MKRVRLFLAASAAATTLGGLAAFARAEAAVPHADPPGDVPAAVAIATIRAAAGHILEGAALALADAPDLRGASGQVRVAVLHPGESLPAAARLPAGVRLQFLSLDPARTDTLDGAPIGPGAWSLLVRLGDSVRPVPDVHVLTTVPLSEKEAGRVGAYRIGDWPFEDGSRPASRAYLPPRGLVAVTPALATLPVSAHLTLGDLLTKGQTDVWPKYVVLDPRNLDKVELTLQRLERDGVTSDRVGVISAFRTPWYNGNGGSTAGRGDLSRHMYGDAIDLFIDRDADGRMDDLNGDGRVDRRDGAVLARAAEQVERDHPHLAGGIGIYPPRAGAHAGFVHIDARGAPARW